jgi:hypothetical protein
MNETRDVRQGNAGVHFTVSVAFSLETVESFTIHYLGDAKDQLPYRTHFHFHSRQKRPAEIAEVRKFGLPHDKGERASRPNKAKTSFRQ